MCILYTATSPHSQGGGGWKLKLFHPICVTISNHIVHEVNLHCKQGIYRKQFQYATQNLQLTDNTHLLLEKEVKNICMHINSLQILFPVKYLHAIY